MKIFKITPDTQHLQIKSRLNINLHVNIICSACGYASAGETKKFSRRHTRTQTQLPLPTATPLADFLIFPLSILSTLLKYENDTEWCISRKLSLAEHADTAFQSTFTRQLLRVSLCGLANSWN